MTSNKFIVATTLGLLALSCANDPIEELNVETSQTTLTLSLTESRTTLGEKVDGIYQLYWSKGDKISVNGIESEEAEINSADPSRAIFRIKGDIEQPLHIAYPVAPEGKVLFAENQTHTSNTTFGNNVATMYGTKSNEKAELKHLTAVLKIGIEGTATLQKVSISAADYAPIAGLFDIDFLTGEVTPTAESSDTITYTFGTGLKLNSSTPAYIHIAVPAGEYPALIVRLYDNAGGIMSKTIKAPNTKPLRAGYVREFTTPITYKADSTSDVEIGKPLPLWSEGYLDIHMINSGSGECAFYVMPDGTTMIVDVGELSPGFNADTRVPKRPNDVVRPYKTYANYIKHFMPEGKSVVDYLHISHFHIDHFGDHRLETVAEVSPIGYRKIGPMALYDEVPFRNILDRAYPNYLEEKQVPSIADSLTIYDWRIFIKHGEENNKLKGERFTVGKEQIKLLYNKAKYRNFSTFNICGNGYGYYIKKGETTPRKNGSKDNPGNPASCGFYLKYGNFDYVSAGDITSAPQNRMAYYFRDCADGTKLDAMKGGHHLSSNSYGGQMEAYMFPSVILNQNFYKSQPNIELLNNKIFPIIKSVVFTTNAHPDNLIDSEENKTTYDTYGKLAGHSGHLTLRVAPGGGSYYVYVLDDTNYEYRVKSIHGPYTSK